MSKLQISNAKFQPKGFTLLEVMVAVAILAIVMVSVYKMHAQSLAMSAEARFYTQAPLLAQSKLAELEMSAEGELTAGSGDFEENFAGYSWRVSVDDVVSAVLGDVANDLKRIDIAVSFNNNEYVYSLRAYRLIRQ